MPYAGPHELAQREKVAYLRLWSTCLICNQLEFLRNVLQGRGGSAGCLSILKHAVSDLAEKPDIIRVHECT